MTCKNTIRTVGILLKCNQNVFCIDHLRLRSDLYCVGWGVKLYSISHCAGGRCFVHRCKKRSIYRVAQKK